jgi:hypothetical protein
VPPRAKKPSDVGVEAQEFCPRWHKIGRIGPDGECTPLSCGGGNAARAPKKAKDVSQGVLVAASNDSEGIDSGAIQRLEQRHKFLKVPDALEGDEADKFVTKRLASLAPAALAEVEYRLKLGDGEERYEAALQVLDRTGFGKTDKANAPTSPIIVINAGGGFQAPWSAKREVVDVDVTPALPEVAK